MPELPEVEVVRAGLAPVVTGAVVRSVEVFDARSLRRHPGPHAEFPDLLVDRSFTGAVRRGKFLWLPLCGESTVSDDRLALVIHLGMSGQVLVRPPSPERVRLERIRITVHSPERGERVLSFVDQRLFGSLAVDELVPTRDDAPAGLGADAARLPRQVSHIARDPLDPHFDDRRFLASLAAKKTGIKRVLLDQSVISGIGNIYADEALWRARVHFAQPASALSGPRARGLLREVRAVLGDAIRAGGTSFDSLYVNVNGASGYFSRNLNVYGQQDRPCPRCGRPIVRVSFMNRGSHFCVRCQRLPRSLLISGT